MTCENVTHCVAGSIFWVTVPQVAVHAFWAKWWLYCLLCVVGIIGKEHSGAGPPWRPGLTERQLSTGTTVRTCATFQGLFLSVYFQKEKALPHPLISQIAFFSLLEYCVNSRFCNLSTGGETERSGPVSDVSISLQITRVDLDKNQLLHLPEPVLRGDWVYYLYQRQCQVSHTPTLFYWFYQSHSYLPGLHNQIQHIVQHWGFEMWLLWKIPLSVCLPFSCTLTTSPFLK